MKTQSTLFEQYDTVVVFDTETTGLNAKTCQIIELAMLVIRKDGTRTEYDRFVRLPEGETIPSKIVQITGITDEMLKDGVSEEQAAKDFREAVKGSRTLMIAHNCQFDMCFVRETLKRVFGEEESDSIINGLDWLDSLTVYKDRAAYPHKLSDAISHYGLSGKVANTHRAIDDTKALAAVCVSMMEERNDLLQYINVFGYNPRYGANGDRLGKVVYLPQPYGNGMVSASHILPATLLR